MKKLSLIFLLAVICYLTSVAFVHAGWPINRTLPIEGTVTDATTGEPIENVIISAEWDKLVIEVNEKFGQKLIVTGKDGKYKIPGKISLHIISIFNYVDIYVRHPLYELKNYAWHARDMKYLKKKDRKIHFDIKLLSLEAKYSDNVGVWGKKESLSTEFRYNGADYFRLAKRKKITIDHIEILRTWENIANRFPNNKFLQKTFKEGKEQIIEIMEKER